MFESTSDIYFEMMDSFDAVWHSYSLFTRHKHELREMEERELEKQAEQNDTGVDDVKYAEWLSRQLDRRMSSVIPKVQGHSAIVMLYSMAEYWIRRLCGRIKADSNLKVGYADFMGTPIEKYERFAEVYGKARLRGAERQLLGDIGEVRNCIVHSNGSVEALDETKKRKLNEVVKRQEGVTVDAEKELCLSESFCRTAITSVRSAMITLFINNGVSDKPFLQEWNP